MEDEALLNIIDGFSINELVEAYMMLKDSEVMVIIPYGY